MEISKSTPYVRYRENISSTLHKGTIHIESEYLDRERKTTIESIEGQTWQNMVNGENKEEDILPRLGLKIEGNEDILDTVEQHMPIDTIIGDIKPVANEDGTYTYEISTMEGSYAKTLEGENNLLLTSDGLVGDMYIKYNAQGEEVNGSIVMDNWQSSYTIENSNNGEIKSAILIGQTLVNIKGEPIILQSIFINNERKKEFLVPLVKPNTNYYIKYESICANSDTVGISFLTNVNNVSSNKDLLPLSGSMILNSGNEPNYFRITGTEKNSILTVNNLSIIEYREGMENWDIPYFEGMQSVENPTVITNNSPVQFGKGGRL